MIFKKVLSLFSYAKEIQPLHSGKKDPIFLHEINFAQETHLDLISNETPS